MADCQVCGNQLLEQFPLWGPSGGLRTVTRNECRTCGTYDITLILSKTLFSFEPEFRSHLSAMTRSANEAEKVLELASNSVKDLAASVPTPSLPEKCNLLLGHVATHTKPARSIELDPRYDFPLAFAADQKEFNFIVRSLQEEGLLERALRGGTHSYQLSPKGWVRWTELEQADEPGAAPLTPSGMMAAPDVKKQLARMERSIEEDPDLAIGTAKEFLETVAKTVLQQAGQTIDEDNTLPQLFKSAVKEVECAPPQLEQAAEEMVGRLMKQAAALGHTIAELRNDYGTGHGRVAGTPGLEARHARLIVNIASTLGEFVSNSPIRPKSE